jgi:hypothetical protein
MMLEEWATIPHFANYSVSTHGCIRNDRFDKLLVLNQNQYGVVYVGLMRYRRQYHRSVPLLVARAFLAPVSKIFDTPINRDGDRWNNAVENLLWRPRWFAIRYHQQFRYPYLYPIPYRIRDVKTGEISENSFECAKRYGLLESDVVQSISARTYVWPTYQEFQVFQ